MTDSAAILADPIASSSRLAEPPGLQIDGESRIGAKFRLSCGCGEEFLVPRTSISVECPGCGDTAMMIGLALTYHCRSGAD